MASIKKYRTAKAHLWRVQYRSLMEDYAPNAGSKPERKPKQGQIETPSRFTPASGKNRSTPPSPSMSLLTGCSAFPSGNRHGEPD